MGSRLAADAGGTFTDIVFIDGTSGRVRVSKVLSTPAAPDDAVVAGVAEAAGREELARVEFFLHGMTVGLNSLLQRRGSVVGLLATRGFRDILEVRRGDRASAYDPKWRPQPPLVPRRLRQPVTERVDAHGVVLTPLDAQDVLDALALFEEEGVQSIAVAYLHAYLNPENELATAEVLREAGFRGDLSLSHQVSGEFREYERTSTTVVDAFIKPGTAHYLRRLKGRLDEQGLAAPCLVTRSGGGSMRFEDAEERCFETIMSGPVAGALGCGEVCRRLGIPSAIAADVGGTSFDCCLITDGRPRVTYQGTIDGMPLQSPWVDIRSIGAGGGSIAYLDEGSLLRVGPRSAGSLPGPACYGRGGQEPTVTDAAAWLGMLADGRLAGGMRLDFDSARRALDTVGEPLGFTTDETAVGILRIVAAAMAQAIRSITVECGEDPRRAVLMMFGGAGPLFGTLLAEELEVAHVMVPEYAGGFSAWGLLQQDITHSAARTCLRPLDEAGLAEASAVLTDLCAGLATGAPGGAPHGDVALEAAVDVRYVGQQYTLTIPVAVEGYRFQADAEALREAFAEEYERTYSHRLTADVEVVAVRATMRLPLPSLAQADPADPSPVVEEAPRRIDAYSLSLGTRTPFDVRHRTQLGATGSLTGPAILLEDTCTTYVDAGYTLEVGPSGVLDMRRTEV